MSIEVKDSIQPDERVQRRIGAYYSELREAQRKLNEEAALFLSGQGVNIAEEDWTLECDSETDRFVFHRGRPELRYK